MPATLRVLYVDDDPSLLDIGKLFLEESGDFNVATAISTPEGIRLLEQEKFDAIVSDYQMPGMDGIQFLIEVRSRFGPIPFILFTGRGREEVVIQAINSGADFYLQKGGEPDAQFAELSHMIKSAVSSKRVDDTLRESEVKYRSLFDNAILGIFRTTPEGRYLDMNAAFARIAGYDSPEEMKAAIHDIGKQLYVRPEDRQKIGNLLTLNGVIRNFETEIRHRDGHSIWISINATNVRSENGSVLWWDGTIEDITAHKVAEQALQESEQLLSDIIEKNPMSIQIVDREGFTLRVNPAFMRLFGSVPPPDYSIITDLVKSRPELENLISQVKSGEAVNLPDMFFNPHDIYPELPDVPTRVRAIIFPLNDRYGKPERFVFMHENITGQKQAEEALQGSRRILETIIDNIPSRVFWKDTNLTYLGCNTAFARDAGFENPEDVIGKDDFAMGWRNQAELYRADDRHVIESGSAKLFIEEPQTTPSGKQISLLTSKVPLRNATGNIIGVLGTYLDVTERKQAAEVLKDSEASYRGLFNAIQQALYLLDRQGKFVDINAGAEKMYGYTREEFVGRTPEFLSAPGKNDLGAVAEKIQKAFGGEPQQFGFWGLRKNMEEFPKDVYLYKATYFGEDVVLAIGIDITDRRQAEDALHLANKKLTLLTSISRHDINNQLTVLQGNLGILGKKLSDPELNEYLKKVSASAQRISSMIRFTKEYEEIGVHAPVWQDCCTLVDTAAKQAPLGKVIVKNDLPERAEVFADPLIAKVFYNLMDNAVRYGGEITTIRFSVEEAGGDQVIVCEDDGDGVVAGEKEKNFERGFGKNTGFGLALSREILDITGITICENGEPGKGARFKMMVPKGAWRIAEQKSR
jgi:PAS domain S-box-containing protein